MTDSTVSVPEVREKLDEAIQRDVPFEEKARNVLEVGRDYLGADTGYLTRVDRDENHWEPLLSTEGDGGRFTVEQRFDLEKTYCRRAIEADTQIALYNAPVQGWADDPAFEFHDLQSYLGTPLKLDGEPYGTVCFVSADAREEAYSEAEKLFTELVAQVLTNEQKLRQFQQAVEHAGHTVWITDPDGTIEYVNPTFEEVTGISKEEAIGSTPCILKSGVHDEAFYEDLWATITSGDVWEGEIVDERANGEQFVLDQTISPITDGCGDPQKFVSVGQDITERRRYRDDLEQTHTELREIIDLVPDLIFAKNRDGEYLLANEATARSYGMTPEEVEGSTEAELIPELDESESFRKDDIEVIESGEPKHIPEEELTTADGETRILQTTKIPFDISGTGEEAILGYARDVTELKEYEQELETQRDNLEVLNEVVRHDIRNDLQLVTSYADILEEYVDDENGQEILTKITESANNAIGLTKTAKDLADVMLQPQIEPKTLTLDEVLEDQLRDIEAANETAEVSIRGEIPRTKIRANSLLGSVFRNLLTNGIQHNDSDVPEIVVSAEEGDETVSIRVADNGPGVPDAHKEDIFGKGEHGLESEGTGLGLYLVETLVDRYGGEVWVEDNDPEGAVFVVELPVAD